MIPTLLGDEVSLEKEEAHKLAKQLIGANKIEEAWRVLQASN